MAKIPINTYTTKNVIENAPDQEREFSRGYLGMSGLAGDCVRRVWLNFRFAAKKKVSVRLGRIFERGDLEEERIIRDLKAHGMEVFRREGEEKFELFGHVGETQEEIVGFAGHAKGHPDGRVSGVIEAPKTEHLLEIKTMNNSRWNAFSKKGVKESDPSYYGQVTRYMDKMKLDRTLFIATNKDNEKREYERVRLDKTYAKELETREKDIIISDVPFGEKFKSSWFACKGCENNSVCHENAAPVVTCRSCEFVDLALNGEWVCSAKDDKELSFDDQLKACKQYRRSF